MFVTAQASPNQTRYICSLKTEKTLKKRANYHIFTRHLRPYTVRLNHEQTPVNATFDGLLQLFFRK